MENTFGNLTTIVNFIALAILPYISAYGVSQDQLVAVLSLIIGLIFAYLNAKYPNTFKVLGNNETTEPDNEEAEC